MGRCWIKIAAARGDGVRVEFKTLCCKKPRNGRCFLWAFEVLLLPFFFILLNATRYIFAMRLFTRFLLIGFASSLSLSLFPACYLCAPSNKWVGYDNLYTSAFGIEKANRTLKSFCMGCIALLWCRLFFRKKKPFLVKHVHNYNGFIVMNNIKVNNTRIISNWNILSYCRRNKILIARYHIFFKLGSESLALIAKAHVYTGKSQGKAVMFLQRERKRT